MSGGFFDNILEITLIAIEIIVYFIKKKGYVYHFRKVLSEFNKNNGIKELYKNVSVPVKLK